MTPPASTIWCPRPPSRPLLLQCLAMISLCTLGSTVAPPAVAQTTQLAYYTFDPDTQTGMIRTVSDKSDSVVAFVQDWVDVRSPLNEFQNEEADAAIPSSSDLPMPVGGDEDFFELGPPVEERLSDQILPVPESDSIAAPAVSNGQPVRSIPTPGAQRNSSRMALGAVAGSYAATPSMIGDFFGGSLVGGFFEESPGSPLIPVSLAGGANRFKVAENVSPIPRDRIFFNYNHFHNALDNLSGPNRSLDRFTFGAEKTWLDGLASIELRLPFAAGLDGRQDIDQPDARGTQLGNLGLALKFNLLSGDDWIIAAGSTLTVPTGDDYDLWWGDVNLFRVHNDAVHLAPYLGWLTLVGDRSFVQGFVQADFDLNGNEVRTGNRSFEGTFQDQNLLFVDVAAGHWLHRGHRRARLAGVAAMVELHYTSTLNDTDFVAGLTNPFNRMDVLNATGALHFQSGLTSLRVGGAAPLRSDEERLFDAEVIVQLNRCF